MFKKMFMILVTGMFILGMSMLSFAMTCHSEAEEHSVHQKIQSDSKINEKSTEATTVAAQPVSAEAITTQAASGEVIDVGNKICPVSSEKIDEKTKATYEYEGKIYNFCCAMCIEEFKKDPEKYIKKVEEEIKATSKEESKETPEEEAKENKEMVPDSQMPEKMHQSHQY